jgi:hypothetical protein
VKPPTATTTPTTPGPSLLAALAAPVYVLGLAEAVVIIIVVVVVQLAVSMTECVPLACIVMVDMDDNDDNALLARLVASTIMLVDVTVPATTIVEVSWYKVSVGSAAAAAAPGVVSLGAEVGDGVGLAAGLALLPRLGQIPVPYVTAAVGHLVSH